MGYACCLCRMNTWRPPLQILNRPYTGPASGLKRNPTTSKGAWFLEYSANPAVQPLIDSVVGGPAAQSRQNAVVRTIIACAPGRS